MSRFLTSVSTGLLVICTYGQVLDPMFGNAGQVLLNTPNENDLADDVALMPDGRFVIAGINGPFGDSHTMAARFLSDGQPDPSFGVNGIATTLVALDDMPRSVALRSDGRVLVAGRTNPTNGTNFGYVVQFTADGSLDTTFGDSGKVVLDQFGGNSEVSDVLVDAQDRALVCGRTKLSGLPYNFGLVVRLEPDGTFDQQFFGGGVGLASPLGGPAYFLQLTLDVQQRILVVGGAADQNPNYNGQFAMMRLLDDGTIDTSFASNGFMTLDLTSNEESAQSVRAMLDGRILVGGAAGVPSFGSTSVIIMRFLDNGALDPSWGSGGVMTQYTGDASVAAHALCETADGSVVAVGFVRPFWNQFAGYISKSTPDGTLDPTFGTGGILLVADSSTYTMFNGGVLQPDGKLLVAGFFDGSAYSDVLIQRYDLDLTTGIAGSAAEQATPRIAVINGNSLAVWNGPEAGSTWSIMDMRGRCLAQGRLSRPEGPIQLNSTLPPGVYVMRLDGADRCISTPFVMASDPAVE
ncbi:MAG: hypothetical protein IPJ87_15310 [Flavobacteriales bacterium]|nr:hypothetical protein [Flavobacteriales bacterium]MBK9701731.1 hypothetical protein [Flavobacteriales bacterium]